MSRKRGSVLIVTMGFVVAFTLLGMAALHYAMVQNEATEMQKASMEAFWLADGAVEKARGEFPSTVAWTDNDIHLLDDEGQVRANKYYNFLSRKKVEPNNYERLFRYEVLAYGSVNGQNRYIRAELDKFNLPDYPFVTTHEPVNSPVPPKLVERIHESFIEDLCDGENLHEDAIPDDNFTGVTCLQVRNAQNILVPEKRPDERANVLFIDVTAINVQEGIVPTITFSGPIDGLVQIRGNVKLNQANLNNVNLQVNGALFVNGQVEFIDNIPGAEDPELVFNAELLDQALILLPAYDYFETYRPRGRVIDWQEVADLGEAI